MSPETTDTTPATETATANKTLADKLFARNNAKFVENCKRLRDLIDYTIKKMEEEKDNPRHGHFTTVVFGASSGLMMRQIMENIQEGIEIGEEFILGGEEDKNSAESEEQA